MRNGATFETSRFFKLKILNGFEPIEIQSYTVISFYKNFRAKLEKTADLTKKTMTTSHVSTVKSFHSYVSVFHEIGQLIYSNF